MAPRGLTALPNNQLIGFLKSEMRDKFNRAVLIGATKYNNSTLTNLLSTTANLTYADLKNYAFAEFAIEVSYFDDEGVFTAVVDVTNEDGYNKHLYAVMLISEDKQIATVAKTPIVYLNEQIGGQFPIKIPIVGEAGEVVFRSSKYLTISEAEELYLLPSVSVFSLQSQKVADELEAEIKKVNGGQK